MQESRMPGSVRGRSVTIGPTAIESFYHPHTESGFVSLNESHSRTPCTSSRGIRILHRSAAVKDIRLLTSPARREQTCTSSDWISTAPSLKR